MRTPRFRWVAVAPVSLLVVLAGCASVQPPDLAPPIPPTWQHAVAADRPSVDLSHWWLAFGDPQLNALVQAALRDNLGVAQAHERLLAARTLDASAADVYKPQVRAKTEDAIDPDASASFFVAGFDAAWELPLFGRGTATRRQARGRLDASVADLQLARVSLIAEVVRDWLQLRAAQHRSALLQHACDIRQHQLQLLQVRQRLQLVAASSVDQARAALAQARMAALEPSQAIDTHARDLATLLGRNRPDPAWLQPAPLPDLGDWQLTSTPADMLRSRPEVAQAQAAVLSAVGDAGLARADLFPSIGIGGSIVWSTNVTTHRRTNDNAIASAGPILDIPLFDWGLRLSALHASNHQLQAAVFGYRQAVLDGVADVEKAMGAVDVSRAAEQQAGQAAKALAHARTADAKRVQLGLASPIDQLDVTLAETQAQLAAVDARTSHGLAFVHLYKALGGAPLPDDSASEQAAR